MKSTIRVDHDFDRNEPFLQLKLDGYDIDGDFDLKDKHLKHFIETANNSLLYINYDGAGIGLPQIRVLNREKTPEQLMQFVIQNFETWAHQYFQKEELDYVDSFFRALKVKVSLKAKVNMPWVKQGPYILDEPEINPDTRPEPYELTNKPRIRNEFKEAAVPLMKYLSDNHHPHTYATVDSESAMLIEGLETVTKD